MNTPTATNANTPIVHATPPPRKVRVLFNHKIADEAKGKYVTAANGSRLLVTEKGVRNLDKRRALQRELVAKFGRKTGTEIYKDNDRLEKYLKQRQFEQMKKIQLPPQETLAKPSILDMALNKRIRP